jgi:hypothetical protein
VITYLDGIGSVKNYASQWKNKSIHGKSQLKIKYKYLFWYILVEANHIIKISQLIRIVKNFIFEFVSVWEKFRVEFPKLQLSFFE